MSYHYPFDESWSKQEIIDVVQFFNLIENAYEKQVRRDDVLAAYNRFKSIVPAKSEEKTYFATFEKASGYKCYPVVKQARNTEGKFIKMK
ncbi:UPF0223 family protein [Virgibacillus ihumii]|uniref:UPF0223 family protein n=1 Tax=Virgibacillus ihumii TaxID=2686091 RepID=UPI00157C5A84|nr:UPF0223 family protein [Virgibacillus ihumii]